MDSAAIRDRLLDRVPDIHTVGWVADLNAILEGKQVDQHRNAAYIVSAGLRGGRVEAAAGSFVQEVVETVAIILTIRSIDNRKGDKAVDEIEVLKAAVRAAIAGWGPAGAFDQFALSYERTLAFKPGYFAYSMEFTIADQLRITA